jgi:hypothetical protein
VLEAIADPNTAIAVIGLLTKHLAITLVGRHGEERAKAMLQKIILDAPRSSTRLIHSPPKTALSVPTAAETGPSGDVDCGHCGLGFTSIDVYSRHRAVMAHASRLTITFHPRLCSNPDAGKSVGAPYLWSGITPCCSARHAPRAAAATICASSSPNASAVVITCDPARCWP